jgi:hypothetical protein
LSGKKSNSMLTWVAVFALIGLVGVGIWYAAGQSVVAPFTPVTPNTAFSFTTRDVTGAVIVDSEVHLYSYELDADTTYDQTDLDAINTQVLFDGWLLEETFVIDSEVSDTFEIEALHLYRYSFNQTLWQTQYGIPLPGNNILTIIATPTTTTMIVFETYAATTVYPAFGADTGAEWTIRVNFLGTDGMNNATMGYASGIDYLACNVEDTLYNYIILRFDCNGTNIDSNDVVLNMPYEDKVVAGDDLVFYLAISSTGSFECSFTLSDESCSSFELDAVTIEYGDSVSASVLETQ